MISKYFSIEEIVSPETLAAKGEEACWTAFPSHVLDSLLKLREAYGRPIYVNNWHIKGARKYSGQRPPNCKEGAPKSAHKKWMAFDLHGRNVMETEALRSLVLKRGHEFGITRVECTIATPVWVHIDFVPTDNGRLHIFRP